MRRFAPSALSGDVGCARAVGCCARTHHGYLHWEKRAMAPQLHIWNTKAGDRVVHVSRPQHALTTVSVWVLNSMRGRLLETLPAPRKTLYRCTGVQAGKRAETGLAGRMDSQIWSSTTYGEHYGRGHDR